MRSTPLHSTAPHITAQHHISHTTHHITPHIIYVTIQLAPCVSVCLHVCVSEDRHHSKSRLRPPQPFPQLPKRTPMLLSQWDLPCSLCPECHWRSVLFTILTTQTFTPNLPPGTLSPPLHTLPLLPPFRTVQSGTGTSRLPSSTTVCPRESSQPSVWSTRTASSQYS